MTEMINKYSYTEEQINIINSNTLNEDEAEKFKDIIKGIYNQIYNLPDNNTVVFFTKKRYQKNGSIISGQYNSELNLIFYFDVLRNSTWSHELGHARGLEHTFEEAVLDTTSKGKTKNFMDYSSERYDFWKWQWFKMNPDLEND